MKLMSSAQMREMDRYVIEDMGVSGVVLMTNAAEHVAAAALERLPMGSRAAVFCGTGNNGGDGIGAAAILMEKGVPLRTFLIGNEEKLTPDSKEMLSRLKTAGGTLEPFAASDEIIEYLSGCYVIIDAIFGIGLNTDLRGDALLAAGMINNARQCLLYSDKYTSVHPYVIAADIPSGVQADTGEILGDSVLADMTVTFSAAKYGHFIEPGCTRCGELRARDIGIPRDIVSNADSSVFAVMRDSVNLPQRQPDSHKGSYGRLLIVAGSVGYTGAPALSARAASRMGAGLVHLGVPQPIYEIMAAKLNEEMPFPLPSDKHGRLNLKAGEEILRRAAVCGALLLGPGLGRSKEITELVLTIIKTVKAPIVLDADGLNAIAGNLGILNKSASPLILTPHPGEFMRLGGDTTSGNRLQVAREFATKRGCVLVLKGHRTITALPDGTVYINTTGGPAMAKGGSGDVLAGMIASLIVQKFPLNEAVTIASYIHGLAGDLCADEYGEYSVVAGDIIDMLPKAARSVALRD